MQFARTKHANGTKNTFWLFAIDIQINTPLLSATAKTTRAKILQIGRKQLWMEYFDQVKYNQTYSIITAKHGHGQVWNCFFIYIFKFLNSEIHHYFVNLFKVSGRSIEEISIGRLAYFFDSFFFYSLSN